MKRPTTKAAQAEQIITEGLLEGRWQAYLPSERNLSKELLISRGCLRLALEELRKKNFIELSIGSKKRKINMPKLQQMLSIEASQKKKTVSSEQATSQNKFKLRPQEIIFLTQKKESESSLPTLQLIYQLRSIFAEKNQFLRVIAPNSYLYKNTQPETFLEFTSNYPNAHWILHQCPQHVQEWFNSQPLSTLIIGSRFPNINIPNIDTDYRSASRHAIGMLIAKGHRSIAFLRYRTKLSGDDLAYQGMIDAIKSSSVSKEMEKPVVLQHNFHCENLINRLHHLLQKKSPPTAIVCVNEHHFLTAFSYLLSQSVRIPEDVSMLSLNENLQFKFLHPSPCYYSCYEKLELVLSKHFLAKTPLKSLTLIPEYIAGKTVSNAPNL